MFAVMCILSGNLNAAVSGASRCVSTDANARAQHFAGLHAEPVASAERSMRSSACGEQRRRRR